MKYTIDAKGKKLGRVASEAAAMLAGKNSVAYARNIAPEVEVTITNASQADIPEKKKEEKEYFRHSQYPGGGTHEKLGHLIKRRGISEVFRRAVDGMLPKNKLRSRMIKNLKISE